MKGANGATANGREICSRFFDDLEVGEVFETHGRTVTELDIVAFGAITGDTNPQHVDRCFAERGPFGERIAHGALVLSFALALVPIDPDRLMALRRIRDLKFKRVLRIGDTLHVRARIANCLPVDGEVGRVTMAIEMPNQARELVARGEIEVLWRRSPTKAEEDGLATLALTRLEPTGDGWHELPGIPL